MQENTFTHEINGTTYIITVKSAENARGTFEEKMRKLIEEAVLEMARRGINPDDLDSIYSIF